MSAGSEQRAELRTLRAAALDVVREQEKFSLQNWGGWAEWYGNCPGEFERHLRLRKALGLPVPKDLKALAAALS